MTTSCLAPSARWPTEAFPRIGRAGHFGIPLPESLRGRGCIRASQACRLFRALKLLKVGAGTAELRKVIISDELLGK